MRGNDGIIKEKWQGLRPASSKKKLNTEFKTYKLLFGDGVKIERGKIKIHVSNIKRYLTDIILGGASGNKLTATKLLNTLPEDGYIEPAEIDELLKF